MADQNLYEFSNEGFEFSFNYQKQLNDHLKINALLNFSKSREKAIFIDSDATGAARVFDSFGVLLADFSAEKGGFVAGVDRVIIRERSRSGAKMSSPVMLRLREGNRLSIYDPETKWSAELMGFGTTNLRTFARLLKQP